MHIAGASELSAADFVSRSHAFFGRARELSQLVSEVPLARPGRPLVRFVVGPPGIGKSALLQRACGRLANSGAIVLTSRCRQQGSRPYRALDGVLDGLARHLRSLSAARLEELVPCEAALISRLFPALTRVLPAVTMAENDVQLQPLEQRNRVFVGLRELLRKLSQERTVVLALDDTHWLDPDSLSLLRALLRGPAAPALTLLGTLQSESGPGLPENALSASELQRALATSGKPLQLGGLDDPAARSFAEQLLSIDAPAHAHDAATIAREALGHPRLIEQWVLLLKESPNEAAATSLGEILQSRMSQLRPAARKLATFVAFADGPVPLAVLADATQLHASDLERETAALRLSRLCRVTQASDGESIELAHERVRDVMRLDRSTQEYKQVHAALARSYARLRPLDEEALGSHLELAGQTASAAEAYGRAADRALEALAFARAARLYRKSIALTGSQTESDRHARLGDALTSGGYAPEAARAYLAAAKQDSPCALDLRRRAAELLLVCGHTESGNEVADALVARLSLPVVRNRVRNVLGASVRWLKLRATGFSFSPREALDIPADTLLRIDTCWSLFVGLLNEDPIRAQHAIALHVTLSLSAGEAMRVARGLAGTALVLEMMRGQSARGQELIERAESLIERHEQPHVRGLCRLHAGMRAFHAGAPQLAKAQLAQAEHSFLTVANATPWELSVTQFSALLCHMLSGDLPTLRRLAHDWHEDALARGDLRAADNLRVRVLPLVALLSGDLETARSWLAEPRLVTATRFDLPAYWREISVIECALLEGGASALLHIEQFWSQLKRSSLLALRSVHAEAHWLRARALLSALDASAPGVSEKLTLAEADQLERGDMPGARGLALCVRAAVLARTNVAASMQLFREAQRVLHDSGCELLSKLAQLRYGLLASDGVEAQRDVRDAQLWLTGAGVVDVRAVLRVLMPGGLVA